jgi:LysR family transcriptional regulator, regulator for genes of the gallate degradation pathway
MTAQARSWFVMSVRLRKIWLALMVEELGSFSEAADAMGLTQPAASRSIRSLERELRCALFERRGHSVKATPQGDILLFRAKRAREYLKRAAESIGETRSEALFGDMIHASDHEYRAFIAVYDHTTVSQAALALGVKQPSVSRSLSRLELRLKQALFERRSYELRPTQAGQKLVVRFKLMFRELDQAREEIRLYLGNRTGQVVLGCLPLTRGRLVPDAIEILLSEFPDVNVRIADANFPTLFAMLMHGELDILVGTLRDPLPEGTHSEFLLSDKVSIVVRPEHPLARQKVVTLEECLRYDWIMPSLAAPLRRFFGEVLESHGLRFPERYTEVDSTIVGRALLAKADRIAVLSYFHVEQDIRAGRLSTLMVSLPEAGRQIGILRREDYVPTPLVVGYIDAIRNVAKQMQQDVSSTSELRAG